MLTYRGTLLLSVFMGCSFSALAEEKAEEKVHEFEEVVVTAPQMDSPLIIETDAKSPRQPVPPTDGAGYLKNIPGFSIIRQGGTGGEPLLRGQGGSRLNVLLDNTPLLGGCGGRMDPPTAYIFPESFDTLTVLKGPQSVVHGGGALGTIVVEREPQRFDKLSLKGNASALYGSFDRHDESLDISAGAQLGFVRLMGTNSASNDYQDGAGNRVHSEYWRRNGSAIIGWTPSAKTTLELSVDVSEAQAAYAGKSMDGSQFDREGISLRFTQKDISPLLAKFQAQAYYNYVDHIMDTYSLRQLTSMTTAASQVDHLMQGAKISTDLTPFNSTKIKVGVDFNQEIHTKRSQTRTEYLAGTQLSAHDRIKDMTFDTLSAYGEVTQDLSNVNRLIGGYRITYVDAYRGYLYPAVSDEDITHSFFGRYEHDLKLGAVPVTTFVGLGHMERSPDFWERGKTTDAFKGLKDEKTDQFDVGALFKYGGWKGSVSAFYADTTDYILISSSSSTQPKGIHASRFGYEADLSYQFLRNWMVEATAAYVRGHNDSEDKPLAQTPPLNTSLGLKYDDKTFLGALLVRAASGQDRYDIGWGNISTTDVGSTGGFATLAANIGWRPYNGVLLTAGVDNILDKVYAEHVTRSGTVTGMSDVAGYSDTTRVNEPGRSFWMRGSVKF